MTPSLKKRFWTSVHVVPSNGGFEVTLDERRLKTPAKSDLILPSEGLANAIAEEWRAQTEEVDPLSMPMTRRANAAIDKVATQKSEVVALLAEYGGSDLICYRAEQPQELAQRQAEMWDPLCDWAAETFKIRPTVTHGVMHVAQPAELLARTAQATRDLPVFLLTGFYDLVTLSGSLTIAFAVLKEFEPVEALWDRAHVDEIWQAEIWGHDDEAASSLQKKRQDFLNAYQFCRLVS